MRNIQPMLLMVSRWLLLPTWVWLLWQQLQPDLLIVPAAIVSAGRPVEREASRDDRRERREALRQTYRIGCCLALVYGLRKFLQLTRLIFGEGAAPAVFAAIAQGCLWWVSWLAAVCLVLLVLLHLPAGERMLGAGGGAQR